ncbi:glycine cleavage system protein GcvH [Photobacterium sp. WH77]|uniref:Glycine cleavage system H protein n=1 Tax=Photobacterium arenosum TaxID=2774143 RepID=A0ABR9BKV4_9GAMM|nr:MULTISPECIES: glycine cleavage system protein GcvH [Photobacterium]MBD8512981.1 glycine cleavage system protein GcvH [Photobacterium arenosum]MCG2836692.1 glycine cleavage system protein GcvH [Photobacterium sp. WH77]MCG2844181.1 glycine cleavage system protein GcvH [Photobacterium sp. WH80]MDO6583361.1 glycine cleavage system protein GcvH [Photobacterium sp. 2_MG-2023]
MAHIPSELKFTNTHEWVRPEGDGIYTVGITDYAQQMLGDMVFVDLPEVERVTEAGDEFAVAESVKAASDVYAPISGVVVAINEDLELSPELVNNDPYGDGWLIQIKADDEGELDELLDAEGYQEFTSEED